MGRPGDDENVTKGMERMVHLHAVRRAQSEVIKRDQLLKEGKAELQQIMFYPTCPNLLPALFLFLQPTQQD